MSRPPLYQQIVDAHRAGEVDIEMMSLSDVAAMFDVSNHTVGQARKKLGITLQSKPFYRAFTNDEKWNLQRHDYLERWAR